MPLPAIGAAAARAGAAAGRAGAKAGRAVTKQSKKTASTAGPTGGMQVPLVIKFDRLFSVEGVLILITAGLIDILGLVDAIPIIGTFLSYIFDIVGLLLIGSWLVFGGGRAPSFAEIRTARQTARLGRAARAGKILVRAGCILAEFIPVLGVLPFWTLLVLFELLTGD